MFSKARYFPFVAIVFFAAFSILSLYLGNRELETQLLAVVTVFLSFVGLRDILQTNHTILRNYPIIGHFRFLFEAIRPELRQYFFESDKDGRPFARDTRSVVYQRAKMQLDKRPFGTMQDVYAEGFEFINHSLQPKPISHEPFKITVGGDACGQPYQLSLFNISAMSFGALSANAIMALNKGALKGGFAHDTGEGGFSPYHDQGGDIIWEIGSGYFGARKLDGRFCEERFTKTASNPHIKMIEVKLSQGAKPGHGGLLPAAKVSREIADTRGVEMGVDCISPAQHSAFSTPLEFVQFLAKLRLLSGKKPVGFKLCIGHEWEFMALVKAMIASNIYPDFIVIDGKEGGTGAAPLEFMDNVGKPLREGLHFVHNTLIAAGIRDKMKLGASGKIITAFDMARALALGADWCNSARGFMFALGCIQSLSCHTDKCPTGVATQDKSRQKALDVGDKSERIANFHKSTLHSLAEFVAAIGLNHPQEIMPFHINRRISMYETRNFDELYPLMAAGDLLQGKGEVAYVRAWEKASVVRF